MKPFFYIAFFCFSSLILSAQNSSADQIKPPGIYLADGTRINEYKKTFELKDVQNPDLITLSKIDMSKYWKLMDRTQRVEVIDDVTDLTLILYSHAEAAALIDFKSVLVVMPADHKRDERKSY